MKVLILHHSNIPSLSQMRTVFGAFESGMRAAREMRAATSGYQNQRINRRDRKDPKGIH
jgi:hypothetical protein